MEKSVINYSGTEPECKSTEAAGNDLFADETVTIDSGVQVLIGTGTFLEIPKGMFGQIMSRSGVAFKHNCHVGAGVIDSDYRGEIKVLLRNCSKIPVTFTKGDRIAQIIILPYVKAVFSKKKVLTETERGEGGFGSTGV